LVLPAWWPAAARNCIVTTANLTPTDLINIVPEPSTFALAGLGGFGLLLFRRRKN